MSASTAAPGARRAGAPRSPGGSRDRAAVVAAAALAAVALATVLWAGSAEPAAEDSVAAPVEVPVTELLRACPGMVDRDLENQVLVGAPRAADPPPEGELRVRPVESPAGGADVPVEVPPGALVEVSEPLVEGLRLHAEGASVGGLTSHQVDVDGRSALATTRCEAPAASWWFPGAGATLQHRSRLVLSNVDPGRAVLDVSVLGPDGPIETVGTRGITVQPGERLVIDLAEVAPQGDELAVHVDASRGRVVAAMADAYASRVGGDPGHDWVPAHHRPRRAQLLSGLPVRARERTLVVVNPSDVEALVDVEIAGPSGGFAPAENARVRVPPHSVSAADVSDAIGRGPAAVRLRSDVPVLGTVRSSRAGDTAYAGPVTTLAAPAAAPVRPGTTVALSAGADVGTGPATVTAFRRDGTRIASAEVRLVPRGTVVQQVARRAGYVVVDPREARLAGALSFVDGGGIGQLPLTELQTSRRQPVVRPAGGGVG